MPKVRQSITVCKQPSLRTFVQKRKIETHKIRLYGPSKILPGPKKLIKLDHIFCTFVNTFYPIWMKNGYIWLKLVDIAHLAGDEKVQMIYTFHIYIKVQRKSKYMMQIFQTRNFMNIANLEENFMASWIFFDNYNFCMQSGVVPGFVKLWCMDELEWTMFINLNQRTLDLIVSIIFKYYLFCLTFKKWINAMRQQ